MGPETSFKDPRITRKGDPDHKISPQALKMVAPRGKCPSRSATTPTKVCALQIFTDVTRKGWGAHLGGLTTRGGWSLPESKLHINYLELKAVFLALQEFQNICSNGMVLIATDTPQLLPP